MSEPFFDLIEQAIENGDIPPYVTNRMVLAALRGIDEKIDDAHIATKEHDRRIGLLERWQSRANGAIRLAMFLAGGGLLITVLRLFVP